MESTAPGAELEEARNANSRRAMRGRQRLEKLDLRSVVVYPGAGNPRRWAFCLLLILLQDVHFLECNFRQGVQFAICNRATRRWSMALAAATGASQEDVYAELIANGIPNSRFVPAGVVAVTRAQEYGYSLLYAE